MLDTNAIAVQNVKKKKKTDNKSFAKEYSHSHSIKIQLYCILLEYLKKNKKKEPVKPSCQFTHIQRHAYF